MATWNQVQQTITANREKAQELIASMNARFDAIRRDSNLTPSGRRPQIAQTYARFKSEIEKLQTGEDSALADLRTQLERELFGLPAAGLTSIELIAFRDAQDRADRIESAQEAKRMVERALRSDDRLLVAAVLERAFDASPMPGSEWAEVFDAITTPATRARVDDLRAVIEEQSKEGFNSGAFYYLYSKPAELTNLTDGQIAALAGDAAS